MDLLTYLLTFIRVNKSHSAVLPVAKYMSSVVVGTVRIAEVVVSHVERQPVPQA